MSTPHPTTIAALFADAAPAEAALRELRAAGFRPEDVGVTDATAVTGAGTGAAAGERSGALTGMGIPEVEAHYFERVFKAGGVLVTVRAGHRATEAQELLTRSGGDLGPSSASSGTAAQTNVSAHPVADVPAKERIDAGDMGVAEPAGGAVAGAAAGALAGTVIAGPAGTVIGGAIGAIGGGAAGKAIHEAHDHSSDEEGAVRRDSTPRSPDR